MRIPVRKGTLTILVAICFCCFTFGSASAQSGFEFYFFGQNLKTFQNCNLVEVMVGAVASVAAHELGHALYLELSGKTWDIEASVPSGVAVRSSDSFTDRDYRDFGRAGFALQTCIGMMLTSFEKTRSSDFTKGWVAMNAVEASSYKIRSRDLGDDFASIDRGGGNGDVEFAVVSLLSLNNLRRLEPDLIPSLTKPGVVSNAGFLHNSSDSAAVNRDIFFSNSEPNQQTSLFPEIDVQRDQLQNISTEAGLDVSQFTLAQWESSYFSTARRDAFTAN
jgi:hypothetical protein